MSEECTHDCSNCGAACSSRNAAPQHDAPNPNSSVKKVIGVVSGKGGVGKSMTSALLACAMARRGYHCGILDADITGPSIPKLFGIHGRAMADDKGCWPIQSRMGIDVMSINLLVENEEDPVVWRGPVIAGAVKQFWTDVVWKDVDFLFVDMPPGTGDVPLTVFQSLPIDGVVIVTTPQDLVSMIVAKAVKMANMMHIPVLGNLFKAKSKQSKRMERLILITPRIVQLNDNNVPTQVEDPSFHRAATQSDYEPRVPAQPRGAGCSRASSTPKVSTISGSERAL